MFRRNCAKNSDASLLVSGWYFDLGLDKITLVFYTEMDSGDTMMMDVDETHPQDSGSTTTSPTTPSSKSTGTGNWVKLPNSKIVSPYLVSTLRTQDLAQY